MTLREKVKSDLAEIRYYYARKDIFAKAFDSIGKCGILEKVEKYNEAICKAPLMIYEIYDMLFVHYRTHEQAAEILGYSPNYIYKAAVRLYSYFEKYFSEEVA